MIAFRTLLSLRDFAMSNLSLRGVDASTLARIKADARRRKVSVNRLIVETLEQQFGTGNSTYHDLDALAGKWSAAEAAAFDAATAPFGKIDAGLWTEEPASRYRVASGGRKPAPKVAAPARPSRKLAKAART